MAIHIEVRIGTVTLSDREIEHLEIAQGLGDHHRLSITFHGELIGSLGLADFVAPAVTVTLNEDETFKKVRAFTGVGVRCEEQLVMHGGSRFVLDALSDSAKYSARHRFAKYSNSEFGQVVGFYDDVRLATRPAPVQRKADFVQAGEDDFSFLLRLAYDHKCFVRPEYEKGIEIRHGFDDKRHDLIWGKNLEALTSRVAATNHRQKGAFYEWRTKQEVLMRDRTKEAPASGATKLTDAVKQAAGTLYGGLDPNVLESDARNATVAEFRDTLLRESERALGAAVTIEGVSTNIELLVGDTVDVRDGNSFTLNNPFGILGLVRVTHQFDGHQYSNRFTATPWTNFHGALPPPRRVLPGLVTAEVVNNEDPKGTGRIQVRERGDNPDSTGVTLWARYVTPFAGHMRGITFFPEVGDEVMLAFEEGDPERPYVLGSVFNGRDVPLGATPKRIVTKSGNAIVMDDAGVIEIHSPSGTCLVQLSNDVKGTPRITIHAEGDLFLEATERLQLKCKTLVELVEEDATRIVKGDEQTSVDGSRLSMVKGKDILQSDSKVSLIVGGSALEVDEKSVVSQSVTVSSVAKAQNTVMGAMVQLNPPGFMVGPASVGVPITPETKDSAWGSRENPKPSERVKVTRDVEPKS